MRALTTPDLVLLSLLAERPMHGYQANLELERREVRDWAGVSRPQVYYSIEKLAGAGMLKSGKDDSPAAGPDRSVYQTTAKGRAALAVALEREDWTTARDRPPFLTWLALSWQATPSTVGSYRAVAYFVALARARRIPAASIQRVAFWLPRAPAAHQVAAASSSNAGAS